MTAAFEISRTAAVSAKRALHSALARIEKVRADIIGSRADQLDHAQRDIAVAITMLRDCDREGNDGSGVRKNEREEAVQHEVVCPKCHYKFTTKVKVSVRCTGCRHHFNIKPLVPSPEVSP